MTEGNSLILYEVADQGLPFFGKIRYSKVTEIVHESKILHESKIADKSKIVTKEKAV